MKVIKIIFFLTAIYIFTSVSSNAEEKSCSLFGLFNPCPLGGTETRPIIESSSSSSSSSGTTQTSNESKKKGKSFWKKIKDFGGKDITGPG